MATTVNWLTGEIFILRADMPVIQASPEIRELDTDAFFDDLKNLEASLYGMPWPDTQRHSLSYIISGISYAQGIEIIPPYFVTFEDGQYRVNLVGSNNNIADVATANQVGILSNNSAGLIETGTSGLTPDESADLLLSRELMEADQFFDKSTGLLHYYRRGTTVDLVPPKSVTGELVQDDVSLLE